MDDILLFDKDDTEYHTKVQRVLKRLSDAGGTLHSGKCEFKKSSVKFLGHMIDKNGVLVPILRKYQPFGIWGHLNRLQS